MPCETVYPMKSYILDSTAEACSITQKCIFNYFSFVKTFIKDAKPNESTKTFANENIKVLKTILVMPFSLPNLNLKF